VGVVARSKASIVLMHRRGTPDTMQIGGGPQYSDVVEEVRSFLEQQFLIAVDRGIAVERIVVDPGIGFGKRTEHNLAILNSAGRFGDLGGRLVPVLIGASRKRFIQETLGLDSPHARDAASIVAAVLAVQRGAAIVRVHDVRGTVEAIKLLDAVQRSAASHSTT